MCDASTKGLGGLLEQRHQGEWCPVAYGSRSLNPSEKNYAPIELETLAVVFACKHFHEYVYGRQFIVQSDHQPLKSIFAKSLVKSPPRLQRFLLTLQRYDFKVDYIRGVQNVVCDTFSRAPLKNDKPEIPADEINSQIHLVISSLLISDTKFEEIVGETVTDETLQCLIKQIRDGWPESQRDVDPRMLAYHSYRNELSVVDGMVLKGDRILIPQSMRKNILNILHQGHQGIENVKQRARTSVFWPNIDNQITDIVNRCDLCQEYRNRQAQEPQISHAIPDEPWIKIGTDLFSIGNQTYLIIIDYHSKYFDVYKLPDATARTVIEYTKKSFSKFGIPTEVISDNGPCYNAKKYKRFSKDWDFKHNTSSPSYPKSNGMAERTIQTVKKTIRKCRRKGNDLDLALLVLRTTPRKNQVFSPAEILMNRRLRTNLPSIQTYDYNDAKKPQIKHRDTNIDESGRELKKLRVGDTVRIHDGKG